MANFNPNLPAANTQVNSAELREQFNGLREELLAGSSASIGDLDTLNTIFENPPTAADLELLRGKLNELITRLWRQ